MFKKAIHGLRILCLLSQLAPLYWAASCGNQPSESESTPDFQVGSGGSRCGLIDPACKAGIVGHETLTFAAIRSANNLISRSKISPLLWDQSGQEGESGEQSQNRVIRGNFATDKPMAIPEFDIVEFQSDAFLIDPEEEWHYSGDRQAFHALRKFLVDERSEGTPDSYGIESGVESCQSLQKVIRETSQKAVEAYHKKNGPWHYEHLVGSVTHTIQDSFSMAHTRRDKSGNIVDTCKFGREETAGICFHGLVEAAVGADFIWRRSGLSWVLKPEAEMAVDTTTNYLVHMSRILDQSKKFDLEMDDFFAGSPSLKREPYMENARPTGTFSCDRTRKRGEPPPLTPVLGNP